ncbi:MAG: hypothetical protein Q8936_02860 [Bacillota bacterium]|nr:hypothetical protein [Bacillota bacterium]
MNNKKVLSLTIATIMAVSGSAALTGCESETTGSNKISSTPAGGSVHDYSAFKQMIKDQDKEDEDAKKDHIFRGGYVGNPFYYVPGSGNSTYDSSTSSGWKSWSTKPSSASAELSSDGSYSSPKTTSFTG